MNRHTRSDLTQDFVRVLPCVAFAVIALLADNGLAASNEAAEDRFLEGYVTAVLERDLGLVVSEVVVTNGQASVVLNDLGEESADRIAQTIVRIDGIERVEILLAESQGEVLAWTGADEAAEEEEDAPPLELLPRHRLFAPLIADPRQPQFSAIYQRYLADAELVNAGSANFGGSFGLLGGEIGWTRWELGLLGGVFSIFDLDADSLDLVNSDFLVGPTFALRKGLVSAQLRLYHQSSHLGDEFLLRNRTDRVNLSYEGIDLLGSIQLHPALRIYAGGGAIVHSEPDLDPFSVQAGLELRSPIAFLGDIVRPVAAFDFQARQENGWDADLSTVAGVELINPNFSFLRLLILASYYNGHSPNGQFYAREIEYAGAGAYLYF